MRVLLAAALPIAALLALATQAAGGEEESADAGAPAPPAPTPAATAAPPAASDSAPAAPAPIPALSATPPVPAPVATATTASPSADAMPLPPPPAPPCREDRDCDWLASCVAGACRQRPPWQPDPRCRDDDCRDDGECTFVAGDCEVARPEDCLQTTLCRRHGRCAVQGDECVAGSNAYCLRSERCARKGLCYADYEKGVCREYQANDPVPAGFHVEGHVRRGLAFAGGVVFTFTYAMPVLLTLPGEHAPAEIAVPVLGPLLVLDEIDQSKLLWEMLAGALIVDSLGQAAGITMLTVGFAAPKDTLVADPPAPHLALTPSPGGLTLFGSF